MISHKHKLIFIHIPKCAGRSISHALEQPFDHHTAAYYETRYNTHWNDYTVFTTVRNPYQRFVSMYHYIKKEPTHANHPITNRGNMLPFKTWVIENLAAFRGEFDYNSSEGNRESDGEIGSLFWFSSQASRISAASQTIYGNIHILKYENGMNAVQNFLQQTKGISLHIEHINSSHSDSRDSYQNYYDQELLDTVNSFPPFVKDCTLLNYKTIQTVNDWNDNRSSI